MKIEEMISANRADCTGCEACANICPKNAIDMIRDAEGFAYPKINHALCAKCRRCEKICPALNFKKKNICAFPKTFVATYLDEKILFNSSSGGVFTALSEIILLKGGVVFGAVFDKNWHVFHTSARTLDELANMRGSKYVQSQIGDVYRQVKNALKSTKVLFSGTPCQCAALKNFLGKVPENLFTVDLICHGAPSPALWENYISEFGSANEISNVNFRSKRNGRNSQIEINFFDKSCYLNPLEQDIYGKLFLRGLSERPSCHVCKFKFPNSRSDLTLGDAWGIKIFAPDMFDNRGTSLVIAHTAKGAKFLEQANLRSRQVKFSEAIMNNPSLMIPLSADERREKFFDEIATADDKFAVMEKYFYQEDTALRQKVREKIQRAFMERWQSLAAQIRGKFKRNILIIPSSSDGDKRKILDGFFERKFKNCGLYFFYFGDNKTIVCTEIFSSLTLTFEAGTDLSEILKLLHINEIYFEKPLSSDAAVFIDWLKNCGLPVN